MKKFTLIMLITLFILSISLSVFAESTGVRINPPEGYTSKDRKETEKQGREKDEKIFKIIEEDEGIGILGYLDGEFYSVPVIYNAQLEPYWCGPAAIRQSLSFHKEKSKSTISLPSQSTLADEADVTSDGAWTAYLRDAINNYSSINIYNFDDYVAGDVSCFSNPLYVFETRIKYDLQYEEAAPVIMIERSFVPRYADKEGRHYITVSEYSYTFATEEKLIKDVDPDWRAQYGGDYWDPIGTETEEGLFKAVLQADYAVDNKVMLY